jgi:mycothiol synthase
MERVRRINGDDRIVAESGIREELGLPGLAPEENCYVVESEGELLAYAILHPEPSIKRVVFEAGVDTAHPMATLATKVVQVVISRAKELEVEVLHFCTAPSQYWESLMEQAGFTTVRTYWSMRWNLGSLPQLELPPGYSIRSFQQSDGELLAYLQNAAFTGSWGFAPNTIEDVEARATMTITGPGGILLLHHGEQPAGYCWTLVEKLRRGSTIGTIGMIGIHPAFRSRRLSIHALIAGMRHLISRDVSSIKLDVDAQNTPAVRLYTTVGFKKASDLQWYQMRLLESKS